jgi:hypothetical protein
MTDFSIYCDDGGHPDDQPFLVMAGYICSEPQWLAFADEWRATVERLGLPFPFHMTEFMRQPRSEMKRDALLVALVAVIRKHGLRPFISAIDIGAYKRVNEEFTLQECHGAPFGIVARGMAKELHAYEADSLSEGDRTMVFIEQGTKHYGDVEQIFKRDGIPLPARVPKAMAQVQPADMLAWEVFNWLRAGSPERTSRNLKRLTQAMRRQQVFGGIFYEHGLRNLCKETNVMPRSILKPGDTISFHSEKKRHRKRTIR